MRVKIGNKIYDAEDQPIMIIMSQSDKDNIKNMHTDKFKYITFPDGTDIAEIRKFIDEPALSTGSNGDFRDSNMESQQEYYGK